jgi:hypothetical protein
MNGYKGRIVFLKNGFYGGGIPKDSVSVRLDDDFTKSLLESRSCTLVGAVYVDVQFEDEDIPSLIDRIKFSIDMDKEYINRIPDKIKEMECEIHRLEQLLKQRA